MPTPQEILAGLTAISNKFTFVAIIWHIIFGAVIVALITGWRPTKRFTATALAVPLLSVSVFAWIHRNPFNGIAFLLFALLLFIVGLRLPNEKVQGAPLWGLVIGILLVIFGWVYPHFLGSASWFKYLYEAPTGLIPCPTLSITIGFALLANGMSSRAWSLLLAFIGLFYGLFGTLRLNVRLDIGLFIGAMTLLILAFTLKPDLPPRQA
jgi:hypothetical protein